MQQSFKLVFQEYKYGNVMVVMVQYFCCARVNEARAAYCIVKAFSSRIRSLFLVDQALDSYWSKICGIALLIICPLHKFSSKKQWESSVCAVQVHSLNESVFIGFSGRSTLHIMLCGFGAITSSTRENLQASVC